MTTNHEKHLRDFLHENDLQNVQETLASAGYNRIEDFIFMDEEDTARFFPREEDRKTFTKAIHKDRLVTSLWLRDLGLDQYQDVLFGAGYDTIMACSSLTRETLSSASITLLHGHRKRLLRAAQILKDRSRDESCAIGGWEAHPQLPHSKRGSFLCLTAEVRKHPTKDNCASRSRHVKFLVDSGSDVVTLTRDVIRDLDLECIGTAQQAGAGGRVIKSPVYIASVKIGRRIIKVETVADEVDSLGTPVISQFDHYIQGETHLWLQVH